MPKIVEFNYEIKITSLQQIEYLLKDVSTFCSALDIEPAKKEEIGQDLLEAIMPTIYKIIELTTKAAPTTNSQLSLAAKVEKIIDRPKPNEQDFGGIQSRSIKP